MRLELHDLLLTVLGTCQANRLLCQDHHSLEGAIPKSSCANESVWMMSSSPLNDALMIQPSITTITVVVIIDILENLITRSETKCITYAYKSNER